MTNIYLQISVHVRSTVWIWMKQDKYANIKGSGLWPPYTLSTL